MVEHITIDTDQSVVVSREELRKRDEQIAQLTFQLEQLKRMVFGAKSERFVPADPGQSTLFDVAATAAPTTEQVSYTRVKQGQKKQPVREPIAAHLPRMERVIEPQDLPAGARKIGEEITETLEYTPGTIHVDKLVRPKYAHEDRVLIAPMPPMPFPKSNLGASLGGFCDPEPCPAVTVTAGQTNATCNGAADGSATVVASGGTTFIYAWSPIGGTSATAGGLPAGSYTCTITNECGNSTTQGFSITEPDGYRLNATVVQPSCGSNNGCISFAPAPAGTYFYSWPFPTNMVVDSVCDLAPGAYTILINSENGCPTDTTIVLADVPCGNNGVTLPNIFTPNGDGVNDRFAAFEQNPGNWQLTIYSRWGTEVFSTNNLIQGWSGKDASAGTYYWVLQPQAGQQGERRAGHVTLLVD